MTEDWVVVQVDDVSDDSELEQEVCVGSPPPGDVKVRKAVGQDQPNENDDHRQGQTALREQWGVKTRSKLKYSREFIWYIYKS